MTPDHFAFRVFKKDRDQCEKFIIEALGYKRQEDFVIYFDEDHKDNDRTIALCTAFELDKIQKDKQKLPFSLMLPWGNEQQEYVLAPEIFLSSPKIDEPGNIVYDWCMKHGNSLHHIAMRVKDGTIEKEQKRWLENGWCEKFTTDKAMECPGLKQLFTAPSDLFGVVFELIERKEKGFCASNVRSIFLASVESDNLQ